MSADEVVFDPADDATQQCPYPHYAAMREQAPVYELDGAHIGRPGERVFAVSRYEDIDAVLRDWRTFSSRFGSPAAKPSPELSKRIREVYADGWPNPSTMLTEDPPTHTRYRRLVSKAFTPSRIKQLEPEIRAICEELVAEFHRAPQVEFVQAFGVPLPVRAVAVVLDVPDTRQEEFKAWADASVAAIGRSISDDARVEAEKLVVKQQQYFAGELEGRRTDPLDDFLTALLSAELDPDEAEGVEGGPLSVAEMLSIIRQIQVAGSETTTSLLADMMVLLADRPEEWERIRTDPSRAAVLVEEGLRVASPNQGLFRIATKDTEIAGTSIPAGSAIWVLFGSANHDGTVFPEPDQFEPDREEIHNHVAFGKGLHYCLGAALARQEATIALQVLAESIDDVTVVAPDELRYAPSFILRGLERLDLELTYR